MNSHEHELQMGFTQENVPEANHVCLIYDDDAQRQKVVSEYLAAGLRQGEIVRYFADTSDPNDVRAWLLELGLKLPDAPENISFTIAPAVGSYCPNGNFVPENVIQNMTARYAMLRKAGYRGSRVASEMTWALRGIPGSDRFLEYEALINMIADPFPHNGMCQYDARKFDGATLFQVLQVHPFMVAHGQIVRNPYYLKPEEFLAKFRMNR